MILSAVGRTACVPADNVVPAACVLLWSYRDNWLRLTPLLIQKPDVVGCGSCILQRVFQRGCVFCKMLLWVLLNCCFQLLREGIRKYTHWKPNYFVGKIFLKSDFASSVTHSSLSLSLLARFKLLEWQHLVTALNTSVVHEPTTPAQTRSNWLRCGRNLVDTEKVAGVKQMTLKARTTGPRVSWLEYFMSVMEYL